MRKGIPSPEELARYELFKLHWMVSNGYTLTELTRSMAEYRAEMAEEMADDPSGLDMLDCNLFAMWQEERGFGGNIWPCLDEFLAVDDPQLAGSPLYAENGLFLRTAAAKISAAGKAAGGR